MDNDYVRRYNIGSCKITIPNRYHLSQQDYYISDIATNIITEKAIEWLWNYFPLASKIDSLIIIITVSDKC